jgi:hypothetical protein
MNIFGVNGSPGNRIACKEIPNARTKVDIIIKNYSESSNYIN